MKITFALVVICGVLAFAQAMSKEEQNAIAAQLAAGCKDTEGASDDDVAAMMAREHPTTKPGKCLIACIMETIGVIKDGKPSLEAAIEITKKTHPGNDKAIEITKQIGADCLGVSDGDRCEFALKIIKCTEESLIKQGIDPKTM